MNDSGQGKKHRAFGALFQGTNYFGNDFSVMYLPVSLDDYVQFEDYRRNPADGQAFVHIAKTVTEISHYIRFIAVELGSDATVVPVQAPRPEITRRQIAWTTKNLISRLTVCGSMQTGKNLGAS